MVRCSLIRIGRITASDRIAMNLHGIVSGAIGAVNPLVPIVIRRSIGNTQQADFTRVPMYADPVTVIAQVQALSAGDLQQTEKLNIQGEQRAVYINGRTDGVIREDRKGGDLVEWDGKIWLNAHVLEYWPDWCKFVIVRQDGA